MILKGCKSMSKGEKYGDSENFNTDKIQMNLKI